MGIFNNKPKKVYLRKKSHRLRGIALGCFTLAMLGVGIKIITLSDSEKQESQAHDIQNFLQQHLAYWKLSKQVKNDP